MATPTEKHQHSFALFTYRNEPPFLECTSDCPKYRHIEGFAGIERFAETLVNRVEELEEQLHVKTIGEQAVWDDRDRLEGELAEARSDDEGWADIWCRAAHSFRTERDEARAENRKLRHELETWEDFYQRDEYLRQMRSERDEARENSNHWLMQVNELMGEVVEARQVAAGLLRLARAQDNRVSALENKLTKFDMSVPPAAEQRVQDALAALPSAVRRLVEE